jgi:hypothetical protein
MQKEYILYMSRNIMVVMFLNLYTEAMRILIGVNALSVMREGPPAHSNKDFYLLQNDWIYLYDN